MSCRRVRSYLVPFLKGQLDPAMADQMRAHLGACEACAREKTYLEPAVAILAPMRLVATQTDQGRLIEMVQAQVSQVLPHSRRRAWGWAVAGAVMAALAVAVFVSRQPQDTPGKGLTPAATALGAGDVGMIGQTYGAPRIGTAGARWRTAEQYAVLRVGDMLRTERDQALDVWFTDGSRMRIGPETRISLLPPGGRGSRPALVVLAQGSVSVAVAKARSRFAVRTPAATATATGTRFGLAVAESGRANLAVFSGSVIFANATGTVTAAGPSRTTATAGSAPDQPVSIGMLDLLHGGAGTLRDDFDTPPLNEAVWIPQAVDRGVLIAQEDGHIAIRGARVGNSPPWRARLLTYFFPRQDFSAAISFRVGAGSHEGAGFDVGTGHSAQGSGVSFIPGRGYSFRGNTPVHPFGDEARVFHRLRLEYKAANGQLIGFVDGVQLGSGHDESPYFFLGFGTASASDGTPVDLAFGDFEAQFGGSSSAVAPPRPSGAALAAKSPGAVFSAGPPDAWDGGRAYNPSILKRGDHYEMWYAGEPLEGNWRRAGIGLAYSADGVNWERYPRNPVLTSPSGIGAPCVLCRDWRDGKGPYYKMWHRLSAGLNGGPIKTIAYAESRDGIHWKDFGVIAGRSFAEGFGDLTSPSVLYLPDVPGLPAPYLMYYTTGATSNGLCVAVSGDGIHWRPHGVAIRPSPGDWDRDTVLDSRVLYVGGKFHMFYAGFGLDPRYGAAIGYAVSDDGLHWRKSSHLVVASSDVPGESDFGVTQPFALVDGDLVKIWFVGGPYSGVFGFWGQSVGYAQMPVASLSH